MNQNYLLRIANANPKLFEFVKFGIVGGIATILHYTIYYFLMQVINVNVAFSIGYGLSLILNFVLTTYFTFVVKPSTQKGIGFAFSHLINYLLQLSFLNLFLFLGLSKHIAPIPVFLICIPINFLLVRYFFKK